jgi:hypothetical protein
VYDTEDHIHRAGAELLAQIAPAVFKVCLENVSFMQMM